MARTKRSKPKLGDLIQARRQELGLSQRAVAEAVGMKQSAVSQWEHDATCPDVRMIDQLARVLQMDREVLIDAAIDYAERFDAGKTNRRETPSERAERARRATKTRRAPARRG